MISAANSGEGFDRIGWQFDAHQVFDARKLLAVLNGLNADRIKATVMTTDGALGYNLSADGVLQTPLNPCTESRIEIIARHIDPEWERALLACVTPELPVD